MLARIGESYGRYWNGKWPLCWAVLTDMDRPLGHAIGNALEIREVIEHIEGHGPEGFNHECLIAGSPHILLGQICDYETALSRVQQALNSETALERLRMMIDAQKERWR